MKWLPIIALLVIGNLVKAQNLPYTNQTEAGILIGEGVSPSFSAQTFNGVKIKKWKLEAGLTAGVDIYQEITVLPLAAGIKWNPFDKEDISPFISLNAGYGFDWLQRKVENQEYEGGYMINPSVGLRIKTKKAVKLNLSLGYKQQRAVIYPNQFTLFDSFAGTQNMEAKDEYKFRRLNLSFGLSF